MLADLANNKGYTALETGDFDRAESLLHESITAARTRADAVVLAVALANLAILELRRAAPTRAARHWLEALSTRSKSPVSSAV